MGKTLKFFLNMPVPTVTSQQKRARRTSIGVIFYDSPQLKAARTQFTIALKCYRPKEKLQGALELKTTWIFRRKSPKVEAWKTTRPDTDNIIKLFKDCMTRAGFWNDDAQVARELTEKITSPSREGVLVEIRELEELA